MRTLSYETYLYNNILMVLHNYVLLHKKVLSRYNKALKHHTRNFTDKMCHPNKHVLFQIQIRHSNNIKFGATDFKLS